MTVAYSQAVQQWNPAAIPFEALASGSRGGVSPVHQLTGAINNARKDNGKEALSSSAVQQHLEAKGGSVWNDILGGVKDVASVALPIIATVAPLLWGATNPDYHIC